MPYKANQPRRHKIPKAHYKLASWVEYNASLQRHSSLEAPGGDAGCARGVDSGADWLAEPASDYPGIAIETGMMLRLAFDRPWRQACWA